MTGPASEALVKAYAATDDAEMARRIAEASYENAIRQRDEARAEAERLREHARALLSLHTAHHNHPTHAAARAALNTTRND